MAPLAGFLAIASLFVTGLAAPARRWANDTTSGSDGPILDLGYAKYLGSYNATSDINTWNGIYFAQAPVGDLRWQAPQDIELKNDYADKGVINATAFGPACVQGYPTWGETLLVGYPVGQEDCLLLNIQTPAHPKANLLPIMIFIHGGGYTVGDSQIVADELMMQSNGSFVYASLQYRLGVYGFLANTEIIENGAPNAGLLDQRAAIQWVQRHATAFGGDPEKITIYGGSAGGGSVTAQMIMYGGDPNPPFRAAIPEYPWWQSFHNKTTLEGQYSYLLQVTGCGNLDCLRGLSEADLAAVQQKVYDNAWADGAYGYGDFYFGPAVDGTIIKDLPTREFAAGHFTKVPVLVDRDGYEGVAFSNTSITTQAEELADLQRVWPDAKQSFWNRLYDLYKPSDFNSTFYHRAQIFGDVFVECPSGWIANAVADAGLPVYKLIFYAGTELHATTYYYLFTSNDEYGTYMANRTIGTYMRDWFISFTTDLDPNAVNYSGVDKPNWPLYDDKKNYDNGGFNAMVVNFTSIGVNKDFDVSDRCDFFHGQQAALFN